VGKRLAETHQTILKLDVTQLLDHSIKGVVHRDYDLGIFNIRETFADRREVSKLAPITRLQHKLYRGMPFIFRYPAYVVEPHFHFAPEILKLPDDVLLHGYWQCEQYFKDIEPAIRQAFTFKADVVGSAVGMAQSIASVEAVCVHVRRGDFVSNPFHGTSGIEYFHQAVALIAKRVSNPHWFVFSDDLEWCMNNLPLKHAPTFVPYECAGEKSQFHLRLMTMCRHFIISNSTFAWWAAWLNTNPEKMVVAPKRWFADSHLDTKDLIPETWIRI